MASMRTIGVKLRLLVGPYKQDAVEAAKATDQLGDSITKAGKKSKADLDAIAMKMGIAGAAALGLATAAVVAAASFDKQMSEVGAVAGATADEMEKLRKAAIDAGAATVFSAKDAAEAEAELAKAGIATSDILGGALAGSLSLASAGSLDLATSAEIAAAAMNTFGLGGKDVEHVADVLAAAANKSSAGVDDLGQGLQQVGLVANQVGLSFEETVAVLAAFADRGLKGSDGATSLKTALQRLAAPTDGAKDALKELGISMYDASGNMVSIVDVAGQLQNALKDLAPAQRNAALQTIFGSDAIRAANVLYSEGAEGIQDYIDAVDDQGAAARMAQQKLDNLAGDVEQLTGSLETLFISSGEGANGGLRALTQGATDLVNLFGELPPVVQGGAVVVAGLTGVTLLGAAGFMKARSSLNEMLEEMRKVGPVSARAADGLGKVASTGAKVGGVLAAITVAGMVVDAAFGDELNPQIDALAKSLNDFADAGKAAGEFGRIFGDDAGKLDAALEGANANARGFQMFIEKWTGTAHAFDNTVTASTEKVQALDSALAAMVQSGDSAAAAQAFQRISERARELHISTEDLTKLFPNYTAALEVAGEATTDQAVQAEQAKRSNIELAGAFGAAASEANGLKNAFDELNGAELDWRDAERKAEAAVDDLVDALDESNGSLDVHDAKGRAAASAVDALAVAAADAAQKKFDETHSVEDANKAYQGYIEQLRQALINAGHTEASVDELIAKIAQIPSYKATVYDFNVNVSADFSSYWAAYGAHLAGMRWGGAVVHAAQGSLSQASMFKAGPSPLYAFAEPETGGEAFVPKRGNYGRSMSILKAAAGWYNADVVPRGGFSGGGGEVTFRHEFAAKPGTDGRIMRAVIDGLRVDTTTVGAGNVQDHVGRRGRI